MRRAIPFRPRFLLLNIMHRANAIARLVRKKKI